MPAPITPPGRLPDRGTGISDDQATEWPDWDDVEAAHWDTPDSADWDPPDSADWDPAESADWDAVEAPDLQAFAAGGIADDLPPGPRLAGFMADAGAIGLGRLTDDELIGVMRAARRMASWSAAMELAAAGDLWRRRWTEEQAGDTRAACHVDDEIAAALTLTRRAADQVLNLAVALRRLPLTSRALTAGDIDLPRAMVIAAEVTGLSNEHAAAVEEVVIGAAAGQTTGELRAATRRAVLSADPQAARKRKERALQDARVERWDEHGGTAALAGRDLPPASALAADKNLSALARQLKRAGAPGTLDQLRAQVYLALLTGTSIGSLIPAGPDISASPGISPIPDACGPSVSTGIPGSAGLPDSTGTPGSVGIPGTAGFPGGFFAGGAVNLTMPLASWLGLSDAPGHVAGYGPLDADDSRAIADALSTRTGTRWCLTLTDSHGRPVAHGCACAGPPAGQHRVQWPTGPPGAHAPDGPKPRAPDKPQTRAPEQTWTFSLTLLAGSDCDHARETAAYRPSPGLRHLLEIRHATCTYPGCRQPAVHCDADHTVAYQRGGRTCLCNLAPLCRKHHGAKQAPGWHLVQDQPGQLTWRLPSGRIYVTGAEPYPV